MPKLPRWASFALLPFAAFCDGAAYYGMRTALFVYFLDAGQEPEQVSARLAAAGLANLAATAIAGGVAIAIGPWVGGAIGAGAMLAGALALGVLPVEVAGLGVFLISAGHGAVRVSMFGAGARAFPDFRTEQLRNATFLLMYGATNLAAGPLHVTKVDVPSLVAIGVGFLLVSAGLVTLLGAESVEDAMYRELDEEVGLKPDQVVVLGRTRGWLRYRLPARFIRRSEQPVCIGQKQKWFLLRLTAPDSAVTLDAHPDPEFDAWRWVRYWHPLREVVYFKRQVYEQALNELAPLLYPDGAPTPDDAAHRQHPMREPSADARRAGYLRQRRR